LGFLEEEGEIVWETFFAIEGETLAESLWLVLDIGKSCRRVVYAGYYVYFTDRFDC
jgi:hypothetical protein